MIEREDVFVLSDRDYEHLQFMLNAFNQAFETAFERSRLTPPRGSEIGGCEFSEDRTLHDTF